MPTANLFRRKKPIHDGENPSSGEERTDPVLKLTGQSDLLLQRPGPKDRALDEGSFPHEETKIDFGLGTRGNPHHDMPAPGGQDLEIPAQISTTHQIQNQVDPTTPAGLQNPLRPRFVS